jgi:hypothetical protein
MATSGTYTYAVSTADLSPVPGNTPFGYYDQDPSFQNDAQRACFFVTRRLGFGTVDVELCDFQIYAAYEEAVTTYGNEVYQYKIQSNYLSLEGAQTDTFLCEYNITYFTASVIFSSASVATWSEVNSDGALSQSIVDGLVYKISGSYLPSMSMADPLMAYAFSIQNCGKVLNQYTYISGSLINFFVTDTTLGGKNQTVNYIKFKSAYNLTNKLIKPGLVTGLVKVAESYGQQSNMGAIPIYKGKLHLKNNQQVYDMNAWAQASASISPYDGIEITRVFYEPPPPITQYYDPYLGLGGVPGYADSIGLNAAYPGSNFMMWPIYFDIQRIQEIEMSREVRTNDYTFNIVNNQLTIFPIPYGGDGDGTGGAGILRFEYRKLSEVFKITEGNPSGSATEPPIITDMMRVPYSNPIYSNINSVGKSWVMRYTLSLCKETLGYIRGKYPSATLPGVGAMSSTDLTSDARTEKEQLLTQLREILDSVSTQKQLERKALEAQSEQDALNKIPFISPIYIM